MPTQVRPYEFASAIRRQQEALRVQAYREAVRGSIAAHSITADKIAVGVLNVGSGAVTIDNGVITGDKLAVNTITATQIDVGAVGNSELGDDSVTGVKIVNGSITAAELNVGTLSAITANMGTLTAGTINGGTIISGSGSPQATFGPDGIILTNAQTSEAVNHAPSHVDFYSDGAADAQQKGTIACFIGPSNINYAPHFTMRALLPVNSAGNPVGRASLSAWDDNGTEFHTLGVYAHSVVVNSEELAGYSAALAFVDGSKLSGTWSGGDVSAMAFHSLPSDRAAKRKIKRLGGTLDAVKALKPVSYELKQNGEAKVGFVAEEVQAVLPDAVAQIPTELDRHTGRPTGATASGVDLMHLLTHAIGAVQELASRVEALEQSKR